MHADPHLQWRACVVAQGQGQRVTIAALLLAAASIVPAAHASSSTIGRTWPIAEPDAMAQIEARTAKLPPGMAAIFGRRASWTAMKAAGLATASADRVRTVIPFYTLDQDIRLPEGTLLYPIGFTFNPLTYVSLPQRLVIVHPRDLDWALRTARLTDFILLTAGDRADPDALTLGDKVGRPLYILQEQVKARLGLTVAPVIVQQVGQKLQLTEVRLAPPLARNAVR